jgi:hypothetical protein
MMVIRGGMYLVGARYTLVMLCRTTGLYKVIIVSVGPQKNLPTSGSNVTSCNNEILSTPHFFSVAYIE